MDWRATYASQTDCEFIDEDASSNFFRVWTFCISCGLVLFLFFAVPICLRTRDRGLDAEASESESRTEPELKQTRNGTETTWEDAVQEFQSPSKSDGKTAIVAFDSPLPKHGDIPPGTPSVMRDKSNLSVAAYNQIARQVTGISMNGRGTPTAKMAWEIRKGASGQVTGPDVDDPTPNLKAARQHLKRSSPVDHDGKWRCVWGTTLEDVGHIGGPGMELYFRLVRGLGLCFCCMSICTMPLAILNWHGSFVPDTGGVLAQTTIGNLGMIAPQGLSQESRLIILGCQGVDIKKLTPMLSYLDAVAAVIFAVYVAVFRFWFVPQAHSDIAMGTSNFAVEIDCLPREIEHQAAYEHKLHEHLVLHMKRARDSNARHSSAPPVAPCKVNEVTLVRDYGSRLGRILTRARLLSEVSICDFKGDKRRAEKLKKRIEKLSLQLKEKLVPERDLPVVRAYAVLNTTSDVRNLLLQYRFANFSIFRCCQRRAMRFQGSAIRIRSAPDPTNLIPENQDISKCNRRGRLGLIFIIWLITVVVASTSIYLIGRISKSQSKVTSVELGSKTCDGGTSRSGYSCKYSVAIAWSKDFARNQTGDALNCYCNTVGYQDVLQDSELRDDICRSWLVDASKTITRMVAVSLLTIIINSILLALIMKFAEWERPVSHSALSSSIMVKVFVSQFVNTAVIVFLVNYDGLFVFNGKYSDFGRDWFADVGSVMSTTLLMNGFAPAALNIFYWLCTVVHRCCTGSKLKHQAELLQLYTNPPFDISYRYAQVLVTCFCTLLYSPGLPLVNLFATLFFFITYWTDKCLLLRGSCRPPNFDKLMPVLAGQLLLFAAPLHFISAVAMYSHSCVFPSNPLGGVLGSLSNSATSSAKSIDQVDLTGDWMDRLFREASWTHSALILASLILIVFNIILLIAGATFGEAWNFVLACCCPHRSLKGAHRVAPETAASVTWDDAVEFIETVSPPASYKLERHPEFEPFVNYLRMNTSWDTSDSDTVKPTAFLDKNLVP